MKSIALAAALEIKPLSDTSPVLVAGHALANTRVRWVHAIETLEIAALLRGRELLLTGGATLGGVTDAKLRRFVESLAAADVAALAIETGKWLDQIPPAVLAAGDAVPFPIIELRKFVPFVEVAEGLNSRLVHDGVTNLQRADEIGTALSDLLQSGRGPDALVESLAAQLVCHLILVTPSSELVAAHPPEAQERWESGLPLGPEWRSHPIAIAGVAGATLWVGPSEDPDLTDLVAQRSCSAFSLAMAADFAPAPTDVAAVAFLRAALEGGQEWKLQRLANVARLTTSTVIPIVARFRPGERPAVLEGLLRRHGTRVVGFSQRGEYSALLQLSEPHGGAAATRKALLATLRGADLGGLPTAVGPVVEHAIAVPQALAETLLTLEVAWTRRSPSRIFDHHVWGIERLAARELGHGAQRVFIDEQLGGLLRYEDTHQVPLLETLDVWLSCGCSVTEASKRLSVRRQSMHGRLERIFELLGSDPRSDGNLPSITLAARLALTQRKRAMAAPAEVQ